MPRASSTLPPPGPASPPDRLEPAEPAPRPAPGRERIRTQPYLERCEASDNTKESDAEPGVDVAGETTERHRSATRLTRPHAGDEGRYAIIFATAKRS